MYCMEDQRNLLSGTLIMKTRLIIIFVLILSLQKVYAQDNETPPKEIQEFWNEVDSKGLYNDNKEFTQDEARSAAVKLYKAISASPKQFENYLSVRQSKIKEEYDKTGNRNLKPARNQLREVMNLISGYFGESFTHTIMTPYYFSMKVVAIKDSFYYSTVEKHKFFCKKITCEVLEVIKGERTLPKGNLIEIVYLPQWYEEIPPILPEENKVYFAGARVTEQMSQLLLSMNSANSFSLYPIVNDTVEIHDDYWELGKVNSWSKFKKSFKSKYAEVK